jgi:toxin FitB
VKRYIVDSNIIIYAADPAWPEAVAFIESLELVFASEISLVETLGFHRIRPDEALAMRRILLFVDLIPVNRAVIDRALSLRQQRKMSLGDALIAATALVHDLTLATRNTKDFAGVAGLRVVDPLDADPGAP